jgi:guanine deaminase
MNEKDMFFMQRAIDLAKQGMNTNSGGPFGAVVVRNNC